jgi:hypothetical protein
MPTYTESSPDVRHSRDVSRAQRGQKRYQLRWRHLTAPRQLRLPVAWQLRRLW